jgi:hypothetical protein
MKNMNLDLKQIKPLYAKISSRLSGRMVFIAVIGILLAYVFVVWRISSLTTAEPTPEAVSSALSETNIPKVDEEAIEQIQSLEESSNQVKSLFDKARNNPFQE